MANELIQKLTTEIKSLKRSLSTHKGNYTKLKTKYEQSKIQVTQLEEARKADKGIMHAVSVGAHNLCSKIYNENERALKLAHDTFKELDKERRIKWLAIAGFVIVVIITNFF